MVLRRTQLAQWWKQGRVELLTPQEYVSWLADFVERLSPDQVLHRITGDSPAEDLLAPHWDLHKNAVRELLAGELRARGTRQGALFCAERELDQSRK
jgi:radical SAM superfamily enzyme